MGLRKSTFNPNAQKIPVWITNHHADVIHSHCFWHFGLTRATRVQIITPDDKGAHYEAPFHI